MSKTESEKAAEQRAGATKTGPGAQAAPEDLRTDEQKEQDRRALINAPPEVQAVAERLGGQVPRSAPKGGEGVNAILTDSPNPELEPPVPPQLYRHAPVAPGEEERERWGGTRPTAEELEKATEVEVRTVDPKSAGFYVAGIKVERFAQRAPIAGVLRRGASHLAALASDPRIEVRIPSSASSTPVAGGGTSAVRQTDPKAALSAAGTKPEQK